MAPELVRSPTGTGDAAGGATGYNARQTDAWAMGVLLYVLLCARYPFAVGWMGAVTYSHLTLPTNREV